MKLSNEGTNLIKEFESFRSNPYHCSAGVATIGYGTTIYPDGTRVSMSDSPITEREASDFLRITIDKDYGKCVNDYVNVNLTQNQFDALVSFTYNLGCGSLKSSTLLKRVNEERHLEAADEFLKWVYANGEVLNGLVRRREAERELYLL